VVISKKETTKFFEEGYGIGKDVFDKISAGEKVLASEALKLAGDIVKDTKEQAEAHVVLPTEKHIYRVFGKREKDVVVSKENSEGKRVPTKTGETKTVFGGAKLVVKRNIPSVFLKEGEVLDTINNDIESAFK
jgi:hypothetical protein